MNFLSSLTDMVIKFDRHIQVAYYFYKSHSDDKDAAELQIMVNCLEYDDSMIIFG